MDGEILQQILDELREAKEERQGMGIQIKGIITEISGLKSEMMNVNTEISGLKSEMTNVNTEISGLKSEMTNVNTEISGLKSEMTNVNTEISGLKSEMMNVNTEMSSLKSEMTSLKSEMRNRFDLLETDIAHLQEDVTEIKVRVTRIEESQPKDIIAILGNINNKIDGNDSNIGVLNKRLFNVESTLESLTNE